MSAAVDSGAGGVAVARPPQITPLTSMRGLAAWWVALYHFREYLPFHYQGTAGWFLGFGYYALDLFFVLSGFVLQINYATSVARLTRRDLWNFAVARFARIYPLHLVMLLVYPLIPLSMLMFSSRGLLDGRYSLEYYLLSLALLQNWGFLDILGWNVPAWSISTEFAAYLLFPLAAMLTTRLRGLAATLAALLAALGLIAAVFHLAGQDLREDTVHWGLPRCVMEFLLGMCVGRIYQLRGAPGLGLATALLGIACAGVAAVLLQVTADYWLLPAAYAAMILALGCPRGIVTQVLNWRWLVYLGEISYATYLSHYFIREAIKFALPAAGGPHWVGATTFVLATFAASVVLYHFVELPSRGYLRRLGGPRRAGGLAHVGGGLVAVREGNRRDSGT